MLLRVSSRAIIDAARALGNAAHFLNSHRRKVIKTDRGSAPLDGIQRAHWQNCREDLAAGHRPSIPAAWF